MKKTSRTAAEVTENAEKAALQITDYAAFSSKKLNTLIADTVRALTKTADEAYEGIFSRVTNATERIIGARDKALDRINEIIAIRKK
jgi:phage-related protein